ncbi:hypothetical protein [Tropicimonas sp. IMCC34043]|uniref:hypothetical protein n=1 Tax=Tropicimonas sp. IMCC34043 TaxID=2248760 RepID=UPI000E261C61|nr:hypothetical protein [Tropicimonas sp. IMCC34043]
MRAIHFPDEQLRLDSDNLDLLVTQLGAREAENVLYKALDDLARRLCDLSALHRAGHWLQLAGTARRMAAIARPIGLGLLARVACDVAWNAECGDTVALAATLSRLERIGDHSFAELWNQADRRV